MARKKEVVMELKKSKKISDVVLAEEQVKVLKTIKEDLLNLVAVEQGFLRGEDTDLWDSLKIEREKRNEKLAIDVILFYTLLAKDTLQMASAKTLRERILNLIEKGNYLEGYVFELLKDKLEIKNRYISAITTPVKTETVYEIDFSKVQKLANE